MNPMAQWSRLVATRPAVVVVVTLILTVMVAAGASRIEQAPDPLEAFVPTDSEAGRALEVLETEFPEAGRPSTIQLVARGDVLDPVAIQAVVAATERATSNSDVATTLDASRAPITYAGLIADAADVDPAQLTTADIAAATRDGSADAGTLLDALLVRDGSGEVIAGLGTITQQRTGSSVEERIDAGEIVHTEFTTAGADLDGVALSTVSQARFDAAIEDGLQDGQPVFPLALVALIVLLGLFFRTMSDSLVVFGGVIIVVVWFSGAQGWLGPAGLDLIGPATLIGTIVPVMLVALTVDYGIQIIGHYREHLGDETPGPAGRRSIAGAGVAVAIGAITTIVAFATNLAGPLPPIQDFGVLAAIGIAAGLFVMTGFVPAARVLLDQRRLRKGRTVINRPLTAGIPPVTRAFAATASVCARNAAATLAVAVVVVGAAAVAAAGVSTDFANSDFLPDDHPTTEDLEFLAAEVGGARSTVSIVIDRPAGLDPATSTALGELDEFLRSDQRPAGLADEPTAALTSSDRYALITIDALIDGPTTARGVMTSIENAWTGDADITVVGDDLIGTIVSDSITDAQTTATIITIATTLVVAAAYFTATRRRPGVALVVVAPIVAALILVLAAMTLFGIAYNPLTAILTSLTIGIGVDYTIHLTHRTLDEQTNLPPQEAIERAAHTTGSALVASALTTLTGFTILAFAPLPAIGELGVLTAITITVTIAMTATVAPALLSFTAPRT